jgi:hypothetical protein
MRMRIAYGVVRVRVKRDRRGKDGHSAWEKGLPRFVVVPGRYSTMSDAMAALLYFLLHSVERTAPLGWRRSLAQSFPLVT